MWTKFKNRLPKEAAIIVVKFGNGILHRGKVQAGCVVYSKSEKIQAETLSSGQFEWMLKGERGKAKKPKRSGREALKDPKVVDPKNRPTKEEVEKKGVGGKDGNMERLVYQTIDRIKSGMSVDACRELICEEINPNTKKPYHERFADEVTLTANKLIKQDYDIQRSEVISIHTQRYDREIEVLLHFIPPWYIEEDWKREEAKNIAYMNCLGVLHQKEELLGMHRKAFRLIINNEETTIIKNTKPNIDLSKLTLEEKIELNQLMEKSRRTEDEIGGVILRSEQTKVIEDIQHEVVEERLNIDRMENKQPKEFIEPLPQNMALSGIQEKMRLALRRKAKEELERVGSKTVEFDNPEHLTPVR